jgi:hypothetical protein
MPKLRVVPQSTPDQYRKSWCGMSMYLIGHVACAVWRKGPQHDGWKSSCPKIMEKIITLLYYSRGLLARNR